MMRPFILILVLLGSTSAFASTHLQKFVSSSSKSKSHFALVASSASTATAAAAPELKPPAAMYDNASNAGAAKAVSVGAKFVKQRNNLSLNFTLNVTSMIRYVICPHQFFPHSLALPLL
jgi:hypothetical protein